MAKLSATRQLAAWLWQAWKGYRLQAVLNTLVGLLIVGAGLAFVWATKLAIDIATHVETTTRLSTAFGLLVGLAVLQIVLGVASRWIRAVLGVAARNTMQRRLFARLLNCRWQQLKQFHTGNLLNRIEQDVSGVVGFLTESIPTFVTTCVQFLGAFLFLFWMDRRLACLVVIVLPFFLVCSKLYMRKMRRLTHDIRDEESRVQSVIQESLQHALVIKTLERSTTVVGRLRGLQSTLHGRVLDKTKYSSVSSAIMNAGFATGYLITFTWGVGSLSEGLITYGTLIAFIQLVGQIQGPVRTLASFIPVFINAFTATERLMELEAIPLEESPTDDDASPSPPMSGIRFTDVSFAYAGADGRSERNIFHHFNFDFSPGSITAIVGETGAGKTTLIRLLLALIEPAEGRVTAYDDRGHAAPVSPAARRNFSYVPQGNTLLSGTIRDNLQLGDPAADDDAMKAALTAAAADFVLALPQGLDTRCGEMGAGLSEGQAQRIAIARALLRHSPILLLDEATSSLDAATEKRVLHNIVERCKGTTVIFVTHRPEALKYCTQVLNLEKIR